MTNKMWDEEGNEVGDWAAVDTAGDKIKYTSRETQSKGFGENLKTSYGICATCASFDYSINDAHQIVFAKCSSRGMLNTGKYKLEFCASWRNKSELSLTQMYAMATLIDLENIKDKPGFIK